MLVMVNFHFPNGMPGVDVLCVAIVDGCPDAIDYTSESFVWNIGDDIPEFMQNMAEKIAGKHPTTVVKGAF